MVAYGVLELKEPKPPVVTWGEQAPDKVTQFENDQLRKLVSDELLRYGLLLKRNIVPKGAGWRTKQSEHILLGQLIKGNSPSAWRTREELCVGSFKECCTKAAEVLDAMERSQELGT